MAILSNPSKKMILGDIYQYISDNFRVLSKQRQELEEQYSGIIYLWMSVSSKQVAAKMARETTGRYILPTLKTSPTAISGVGEPDDEWEEAIHWNLEAVLPPTSVA